MSAIMGLYEEYVKERSGAEAFFDTESFVIYKITGEEIFLQDMFIKKSARGSGKFRDLIGYLVATGKRHGCKVLGATIYTRDPGSGHTMSSALKAGFRITAADNGVILLVKELGE